MTAGIFISLSVQASCECESDRIPFSRTFKSDVGLNPKYPCGIKYQKDMTEKEGHEFYTRG